MLLLIAGIFIVTFLAVCAVAYVVLARRRTEGPATTWKLQFQSRLPVSKRTFEQISRATAAAAATPEISPATRASLDQLDQVRGVFVSIYRVLMIVVGLAGLTGGILLLRSHTPENIQGLPGGIIVLVSLGALLKGLVSGPSITPTEILEAWDAGADIVKVFPGTALGPTYLKDIRGPLPQVKLMPTGGVTLDNAGDWIRAGAVAVGVGTALLDAKAIAANDFRELRTNAERIVASVKAARN